MITETLDFSVLHNILFRIYIVNIISRRAGSRLSYSYHDYLSRWPSAATADMRIRSSTVPFVEVGQRLLSPTSASENFPYGFVDGFGVP